MDFVYISAIGIFALLGSPMAGVMFLLYVAHKQRSRHDS